MKLVVITSKMEEIATVSKDCKASNKMNENLGQLYFSQKNFFLMIEQVGQHVFIYLQLILLSLQTYAEPVCSISN